MLSLQVFVFSRTAYSMIKERLKSKGVADITAKELEGYFSPWHAKHIGQIKVKINPQRSRNILSSTVITDSQKPENRTLAF